MRGLFVVAFSVALCGAVHLEAVAAKRNSEGCYHSQKKGYVCPEQNTSQPWGAESPREREKRLKRECKGKPNAGACSGYAT